eukprot:1783498-Pyramimonas_sp.AAC.2
MCAQPISRRRLSGPSRGGQFQGPVPGPHVWTETDRPVGSIYITTRSSMEFARGCSGCIHFSNALPQRPAPSMH